MGQSSSPSPRRGIWILLGGALPLTVVALAYFAYSRDDGPPSVTPPAFEGDSTLLSATEILPTLDTPIPPNKNAIWCASFASAWKALESDVLQGPVAIDDAPPMVATLNKAPDPRPHIPAEALYTAAGWIQDGIADQIVADLAEKFPKKTPPDLTSDFGNGIVAYAYLEVKAPFAIPYFQNRRPLVFVDSQGGETKVKSFGLDEAHKDGYRELHEQPDVLYVRYPSRDAPDAPPEYVVDLDRNSPHQVVLAMVESAATLEEMLASVNAKIAEEQEAEHPPSFGPSGILRAPDIVWRIEHVYEELLNKELQNASARGQFFIDARQHIAFRLDRHGAELESESIMHTLAAVETNFIFDRPFLLYMKERDAEQPYFVMWVDNAELLNRW